MKEIKTVNELMTHLEELKHNLTRAKPAVDVTEEQNKAKATYNHAFWEHMYSGIPENALRDGGDMAKGFFVPDTYEDELVETLRDANFLRSIGTVLNTTQDLHIPVVMKNGDAQWIGDRGKRNMKRLNEAYAKFGQVGFLLSGRVDSKLVLQDAIKALKVAE